MNQRPVTGIPSLLVLDVVVTNIAHHDVLGGVAVTVDSDTIEKARRIAAHNDTGATQLGILLAASVAALAGARLGNNNDMQTHQRSTVEQSALEPGNDGNEVGNIRIRTCSEPDPEDCVSPCGGALLARRSSPGLQIWGEALSQNSMPGRQ